MPRDLTVEEIIAILPETPRRITELTAGLTPEQLRAAPDVDAWSVNDVVAHLRACHDVLGGNVLRIIAEDRPTLKGMSPRAWLRKTDYRDWQFAPAFDVFRTQRAELLAVVEPLPAEDWERTATVTGMVGDSYQRSARYFADWMAGHERTHWKHISQIVAVVGTAPDIPDTLRQGSERRVSS